jgi:hypothetical protein
MPVLACPANCRRLKTFALKRDRMEMPALVRLAPMHRAAVAKEALVGMGVDADVIAHRCPAFSNRIRIKLAKSNDSARIVGRTKTSSRFASPYLYGTKINLREAPQS